MPGWILMIVLSGASLMTSGSAASAEYPQRPVRMIAPISPGGGADIAARLLARSMSETLGQQVIVDNRPGGGNVPGTAVAANATPDGYTVLWISGAHAINAAVRKSLPYDSVQSFEPVGLFARMPLVLVAHPAVPAKSVPELLVLLRSQPGRFNYASSGVGTASHLGLELFKLHGKVDMVNVSYKGAAPSIAGLLGGEVQLALLGPLSVKPHLAGGKLRALAVTSASRSQAFPNLPTLAESGLSKYEMTSWYGVLVPRRTPRIAVERLNEAISVAQGDRSVVETLGQEGAELRRQTPSQFRDYLVTEVDKYRSLIAQLGIRME